MTGATTGVWTEIPDTALLFHLQREFALAPGPDRVLVADVTAGRGTYGWKASLTDRDGFRVGHVEPHETSARRWCLAAAAMWWDTYDDPRFQPVGGDFRDRLWIAALHCLEYADLQDEDSETSILRYMKMTRDQRRRWQARVSV